jgi:hypothetical protein
MTRFNRSKVLRRNHVIIVRRAGMRIALSVVVAALLACSAKESYRPQDGDIVFQTSKSAQSRVIQLATGSRYSHMGIVFLRDGVPFVLEAVQPVRLTPLSDWIARGEGGLFVAKRLRDAKSVLKQATLQKMMAVGEGFLGRGYDPYFEWSDSRIYCSELVWKVYDRGAGIAIGKLQTMADFDLSNPVVKAKVQERFGDNVPLQETVISPAAMFASPLLKTVYQN